MFSKSDQSFKQEDSLQYLIKEETEAQNSRAVSSLPNKNFQVTDKKRTKSNKQQLTFKKGKLLISFQESKQKQNNQKLPFSTKSISFIQFYNSIKQLDNSEQLLREDFLKSLLENNQMDQINRLKIETLLQMVLHNNLRRKKNSCIVNLKILKESQNLQEVDKKRLQILQLLTTQLYKKILIQGLRYNKMRRFCEKVIKNVCEEIEEQQQQDNLYTQNLQINEQEQYQDEIQNLHQQKSEEYQQQQNIDQQYQQNSFLKREFKQQNQSNKSVNFHNNLQEQVRTKNKDQSLNKKKHQNMHSQQRQSEDENFTEYNSHRNVRKSLKQEKDNLRRYLIFQKIKRFYQSFQENAASSKIKKVIQNCYYDGLIKKSFYSLKNNSYQRKQQRQQQKQMQMYYEQIAENQNESQIKVKMAQMFYNSNCITKIFFRIQRYLACRKITSKIMYVLIKYSFRQIKYSYEIQHKNQDKCSLFIQRKRKAVLFKYFLILKNETFRSQQINIRAKIFRDQKNNQILYVCFSAMSLQWKKRLVLETKKIEKVQNIILSRQVGVVMENLYANYQNKYGDEALVLQVFDHLQFLKKSSFFDCFTNFYLNSQKQRRTQIQSAKLQIGLIKNTVKSGLSNWRKSTLCKRSYNIIQKRLTKVKQIEQKGKMFRIWNNRLLEKFSQYKKDRLTTGHKEWLDKYYKKLCAIQNEEQQY